MSPRSRSSRPVSGEAGVEAVAVVEAEAAVVEEVEAGEAAVEVEVEIAEEAEVVEAIAEGVETAVEAAAEAAEIVEEVVETTGGIVAAEGIEGEVEETMGTSSDCVVLKPLYLPLLVTDSRTLIVATAVEVTAEEAAVADHLARVVVVVVEETEEEAAEALLREETMAVTVAVEAGTAEDLPVKAEETTAATAVVTARQFRSSLQTGRSLLLAGSPDNQVSGVMKAS
jgi:hypothetical protein